VWNAVTDAVATDHTHIFHSVHSGKINMGRKYLMKMVSLRILLALSLLLGFGTANLVWAEAEAPGATLPANLKIEQWKGHEFTFLALPADRQAAGYEIFTVAQATQGFKGDRLVRIPYPEHVGKQVTVTEIVSFAIPYDQQEYMVYMTVNETGEKLVGRTTRGQLEDMVLTADLRNARQQFLGKTVYPKFRELVELNVLGWNTVPASVSTRIGDSVKVIDVYAGNQSQEKIWLIVTANGKKAILPIDYSWTNTPIQIWTQNPPWQNALFMEDPKITLGGSYDLWNNIQSGDIQEGMTKAHVQLSWGKPLKIEANGSVWIYNTKKLTFWGDVLYSIETISDDTP